MIYKDGRYLYSGRIICSWSDIDELTSKRATSRYAMPVPGGKIVDFQRKENEHNITGLRALYKVNVRMK